MKDVTEQAIIAGATLGVVLLFAVMVHMPRQRALGALEEQARTLEDNLAHTQAQCAALGRLTREVEELREAAGLFAERLPADGQVGPFLQEVAEHLRGAQLVSQEMRPAEPISRDRYTELPIRLHFEGSFAGVFGFLAQLESMERIKRIVGLNLRSGSDPAGSIQADVVLNIYSTKG